MPTPVAAEIRSAARRDDVHAVVIDAETVPFIDVTAAQVLDQVARELQADGIRLVIAREHRSGSRRRRHSPGDSILDTAYPTVDEAVTRVVADHGG